MRFLAARKVYPSGEDAPADVFDDIERYQNPRRRHSKLGYLSPMKFEAYSTLA
jgi:putative transposase